MKFALNSYGTIHGTLGSYNDSGVYLAPFNFGTQGLFFVVRNRFDFTNSEILWRKSVGAGISIPAGSNGLFDITLTNTNTNYNPREYVWELFLNPLGTTFVDGTTQLKSLGSGIFEILQGAKYGTL